MLNLHPIERVIADSTRKVIREVTHAPLAPSTQSAAGRDSVIGEQNFAAGLAKFALSNLAPATQAANGARPLPSCTALGSSGIDQLVRDYAPVLVFSPDEKNFPASPLQYIDHSELRQQRDTWWDKGIEGRGEIDPAQLGSLDEPENKFLDLDNAYRQALGSKPDAGGTSDAPVHYQVDQGPPLKITYHVFYAYNDGPLSQNHEGDWERITIEFKESRQQNGALGYEPERVLYSAHHGGGSASWRDAEKDENGRLLVFVAKGSHANYATPGNEPTVYDAHPQYNPRQIIPSPEDVGGQAFENLTDDETARDVNGDGRIDGGDGAVRMDTSQSLLLDVREQDWYPQQGAGFRWGEIGSALNPERDDFSGPTGPSPEKGAVG